MLNDERHISGVVYRLSLIEREKERRQPQLKIIYFEAHYPSSLFKTMTCQTIRVYVCRSKRTEGKSKMILSLNLEKKKKGD